jgi:hypothetical protein
MGMSRIRSAAALLVLVLYAATAAAQGRPSTGTLRLVVRDPSGAVIPGAAVQVTAASEATTGTGPVASGLSDAQGVATIAGLMPGRYRIEVVFPGFETRTLPDLRIRAGDNRRDATLALQRYEDEVSVGRDPSTAASDANSERYGNVLTKEQIEALPDDPDEMEQALENMAGPGATIRVDGFRGGRLPPKSQIRSIRFASGMFAAENHGGGMTFVDIHTQPGMGPLRGGVDVTFRDDALNARNAFQPTKGPESTQQYTFNLSGTILKDRTSFSLSAGGTSLFDSANVFAALPDGSRAAPVRRPSNRLNFTGRLDHAIDGAHTLRVMYQQSAGDQHNLGVGSFDLQDRGYSRTDREQILRVSESGSWGRAWYAESRLQLRWTTMETESAVEAPTVRVLDAFTSGGAQQSGGRRATDLEWASNIDWARGPHALKMGALVEAGWYRSDTRTNYLGTYTFTSLAEYEAGRAANYTRRLGDPLVEYSQVQAGLFVQNDWRVRRSLTLSGGIRHELQTNLGDRWNVAPRAGFAWSPFKGGKTTIRGGGGIFYDWLDAQVFEATLRVDGERQHDLVIRNPGFPDPLAGGGSLEVLPTSRYMLAPVLVMPQRALVNLGLTQQLAPMVNLNVTYTRQHGFDRFRGRNINAPLADGSRPDPGFGTITQVESTARMRSDTLNIGINMNVPQRRLFLFANYAYMRQENDADGPFSLPADSYDLAREWGRAPGVPRHVASAVFNTPLPGNFRLGLTTTFASGVPFNITTGRDDNGDTIFTDRPAGVPRNSGVTAATWDVGGRFGYTFGFGERSGDGGSGTPVVIVQRVGGPADPGGLLGALGGGGADNKRLRIELFVAASNLLNRVNRIGYSGVMTSPFFGRPTGAQPGRRIDLGLRVGF